MPRRDGHSNVQKVLLLMTEERFGVDHDGIIGTSNSAVALDGWRRGLSGSFDMRVAARVDASASWPSIAPIAGEVIRVANYQGLRQMLLRLPRISIQIDRAVRESDTVVLRLPGALSIIAAIAARLHRKPVAAEVVGDIEEVLCSGVGGRTGRILQPVAGAVVRRAIRQAAVVRYVTSYTLQSRYPAGLSAKTVALSDVVIEQDDLDWDTESHKSLKTRIVAVGSHEQFYKGHDQLLRALPRLLARFPDLELTLIGDGRYQADLRSLARTLNIEERVSFLGFVADRQELRRAVSSGWLFCMPSRTEGMPRALIEAMAWGLPCVGTAVGGIRELLEEDALVAPDDIAALADVIARFLSDRERADEQASRNREVARRFLRTASADDARQWASLVSDLVNGAAGGDDGSVRVIHLLGSLDRGGAELMSLELVRGIPATEVEQRFVCLSGRPGALAGDFASAGAEVKVMNVRDPWFFFRLWGLLRAERPDFVVSHVELASGALLLVAGLAGRPHRICRVHNEKDGHPGGALRWGYRLLMRSLLSLSAHEVIGVTQASCRYLTIGPGATARLESNARVVYNGVDCDRFREGLNDRAPIVLHVGRSGPAKNRSALLRLAPDLAREGLKIRFVSSDGYRDLGGFDTDSVELAGPSDDIPSEMQRAAVLALPSLWEGLPGVVLEALATGTPVVATALPGIREIAHRADGITLVDPNSGEGQWVFELVRAANASRERRHEIAQAFRASPFTNESFVKDWRNIFLSTRVAQ